MPTNNKTQNKINTLASHLYASIYPHYLSLPLLFLYSTLLFKKLSYFLDLDELKFVNGITSQTSVWSALRTDSSGVPSWVDGSQACYQPVLADKNKKANKCYKTAKNDLDDDDCNSSRDFVCHKRISKFLEADLQGILAVLAYI